MLSLVSADIDAKEEVRNRPPPITLKGNEKSFRGTEQSAWLEEQARLSASIFSMYENNSVRV